MMKKLLKIIVCLIILLFAINYITNLYKNVSELLAVYEKLEEANKKIDEIQLTMNKLNNL